MGNRHIGQEKDTGRFKCFHCGLNIDIAYGLVFIDGYDEIKGD